MSYAEIIERLSKALKKESESQDATAAVALLLKISDKDLEILFVERAENPADPWSGQIAFPGGKRDLKDQNLKETIVRETIEEINVNLLHSCRFLGVMETHRSTQRPRLKVLPFVVLLKHEPSIKLNEELERFFWISLKQIIRHKGTIKFEYGEFPAYIVENSVVWGLTYKILEKFIRILENQYN